MKTDKKTYIRTYDNMSGLVLELAISRLSDKQRKILLKRVANAIHRLTMKLWQLQIMLNCLTSKPLSQDILDAYPQLGVTDE
ncbi:hypothetical protein SEA_EUGENEKRABS_12 [Microbacterium phage EugeneKrabs]|nr:hypothetical protein SEA_EUGENEKRABS_12 [Microbacterium phage EugeneKrabs]